MIYTLITSPRTLCTALGTLLAFLVLAPANVMAAGARDGNWNKIRLYGHTYSYGFYNETELEFIKDNYSIYTIEKRHGQNTGAYKNSGKKTEHTSWLQAERIHKKQSNVRVLFYWNAELEFDEHYKSLKDGVKDLKGNYYIDRDFNRDSFNFNVQEMKNLWRDILNDNLDKKDRGTEKFAYAGAFIDALPKSVTADNRQKFKNKGLNNNSSYIKAQMKNIRDERSNNNNMIIHNGFRVKNGKVQAGTDVIGNASGVFVEGFMSGEGFNLRDAKIQLNQLIRNAYSHRTNKGKYYICRGSFDGYNPDKNGVDFPLACYLMMANDKSYFSYISKERKNESAYFVKTAHYNDDIFKINLGKPTGKAIQNGNTYERKFANFKTKLTVNLNTGKTNIRDMYEGKVD